MSNIMSNCMGSCCERCAARHSRGRVRRRDRRDDHEQPQAVESLQLGDALGDVHDTVDMAVTTEVNYQSVLQNSADFAEAAAAFLEKRKPVFTGR
jgi:hypothetical protein